MAAPDPFVSSLPDAPIPTATLRTLEDHDRVLHVVPLSVVATNSGEETERFFLQLAGSGYILEYVPEWGWEKIEHIDAKGKTDEEVFEALVDAAGEWHAEIVDIVEERTGKTGEPELEAMNETLERELRRKGPIVDATEAYDCHD
jgi:hypothetical protein